MQQKLSEDQRKLITFHYNEISTRLKKSFNNFSKRFKIINKSPDSYLEALSYLPDITLRWVPERGKRIGYVNYATRLCINRFIDQYRKMYKNEANRTKKAKKSKEFINISENSVNTNDSDDIVTGLKKKFEESKTPKERYLNPAREHTFESLDFINDENSSKKNSEIDYLDLKRNLISNAKLLLKDDKQKDIYIAIIEEYIIPKAENRTYSKIKELAQKFSMSSSQIYFMTKNKKMQEIFKYGK